jgi:hypothetical protein
VNKNIYKYVVTYICVYIYILYMYILYIVFWCTFHAFRGTFNVCIYYMLYIVYVYTTRRTDILHKQAPSNQREAVIWNIYIYIYIYIYMVCVCVCVCVTFWYWWNSKMILYVSCCNRAYLPLNELSLRSQNCDKRLSFVMSARPHGTTRLLLEGIFMKFDMRIFRKICPENSNFIQIWQ